MTNLYNKELDRNPANFQPLTPLTFLERAASVFPNHTAIIHGKLRCNYANFYARSRRLNQTPASTTRLQNLPNGKATAPMAVVSPLSASVVPALIQIKASDAFGAMMAAG